MGHCTGTGQEPSAAAVRRANRCAGLCYRKNILKAAAGYLPPDKDDGGNHHLTLHGQADQGSLHQEGTIQSVRKNGHVTLGKKMEW